MKKLILFLVFFTIIACNNSNEKDELESICENDFRGFSEFKIGSKFNDLKSEKFLRKDSDEGWYFVYKIDLGNNIGVVENLYIKVEQDVITNVSFETANYTNNNVLKNIVAMMKKTHSSDDLKDICPTNIYQNCDGSIQLSTTNLTRHIDYSHNKYEIIRYAYIDYKKFQKVVEELKKRDPERESYMQNVPKTE